MENSEVPLPAVSTRPIRLVIIASSTSKFKPIANFLVKRGLSTYAITDVKKALAMIQSDPPDFVLISWNIKEAVPAKIAELISAKLKIHCIAFAEESDTKTAASLASCKVKDIVHAPISGPVLFMRIQKILKQKEELTPERKAAPKAETSVQLDSGNTIKMSFAGESEIHGKSGTWISRGVNRGRTLWMFKEESGGSKSGNYFYEGDWPPVKSENGVWSLSDGVLYREQSENLPETKGEWLPADVEKQIKKQIQEDALKFILEMLIEASPVKQPTAPVTGKYLGVVEIKSNLTQGYLLVGSPNDVPVSELMTHFFKSNLEKSLRESNSEIWTEYDFILNEEMSRFDEWMTVEGKFILEGKYQEQKVNVYFLERHEKKLLVDNTSTESKKALPLDFIRPEEEVTFDVFIRLEKNKKFLKYFKKNTIAHSDRLKGLLDNKISKVFIADKDWPLAQSYEALGYISRQYLEYQKQNPEELDV